MAKKNKKGFFGEFKAFISRGNVVDMAVGVIIGGAFTAIVTALTNGILRPLINGVIYYIFGGKEDALNKMYTFLVETKAADGTIDLSKSIYIDWGAFISAIINFLLIALVLFLIIKIINNVHDAAGKMKDVGARAKEKQARGLKLTKKEKAALAKIAEEEAAAEKAKAEAIPEPPVVDENLELLKEIRDLLKEKK